MWAADRLPSVAQPGGNRASSREAAPAALPPLLEGFHDRYSVVIMARTYPPLVERFWSKVTRSAGCWEWQGSHNTRNGVATYGTLESGGRTVGAHRLSWEIHHGAVPAGRCVLHRCDNPSCVNPGHLWLGSHADNMRDMKEKGRAAHVPPPNARLTRDQVRDIRRRLAVGDSQRRIAKDFGIHQPAVAHIKSGRNWGWLI